MPAFGEHLTAEYYVDQAISNSVDEPTYVRNNQANGFHKFNVTNINSITLNNQAIQDYQVFTKSYVDQFHQENEQSRRNSGIDFCNESSDLLLKNNNLND